jgi:hypothetical protein
MLLFRKTTFSSYIYMLLKMKTKEKIERNEDIEKNEQTNVFHVWEKEKTSANIK